MGIVTHFSSRNLTQGCLILLLRSMYFKFSSVRAKHLFFFGSGQDKEGVLHLQPQATKFYLLVVALIVLIWKPPVKAGNHYFAPLLLQLPSGPLSVPYADSLYPFSSAITCFKYPDAGMCTESTMVEGCKQ